MYLSHSSQQRHVLPIFEPKRRAPAKTDHVKMHLSYHSNKLRLQRSSSAVVSFVLYHLSTFISAVWWDHLQEMLINECDYSDSRKLHLMYIDIGWAFRTFPRQNAILMTLDFLVTTLVNHSYRQTCNVIVCMYNQHIHTHFRQNILHKLSRSMNIKYECTVL